MYKDKEKQKEAQKRHYQNNKEQYLKRCKIRRIERAIWFNNYKKDKKLKCSLCNESNPDCLCFHHKNPNDKTASICHLVNQAASEEAILKEIEKCEVLCHNCHVKYHFQIESRISKTGKNHTSQRRINCSKWFLDYKIEQKFQCEKCKENDPICLCFHHKNPKEKTHNVSFMVSFGFQKKKILEEINKCEILCQNCHIKYHSENNHRRKNLNPTAPDLTD